MATATKEAVSLIVRVMYASFTDEELEQMLAHGREFTPAPEVVALNTALEEELHRRKAEREERG